MASFPCASRETRVLVLCSCAAPSSPDIEHFAPRSRHYYAIYRYVCTVYSERENIIGDASTETQKCDKNYFKDFSFPEKGEKTMAYSKKNDINLLPFSFQVCLHRIRVFDISQVFLLLVVGEEKKN